MKAVVSVIGRDKVGIIAEVSNFLSSLDVNIEDISQTVMQDYFAMIMLIETEGAKVSLSDLASMGKQKGEQIGVAITVQHEDIFNAMHKI